MSQLPTIGAHAALLGVAAFEGSVRQVIYSTNYLTSSIERATQAQNRAGATAAANAQKQADLTAKAYEAEAARAVAAKEAEAAKLKAINDRIIADNARAAAASLAQGAEQAGATAAKLNQGPGTKLGVEAANASAAAATAAANAAAFEKQAAASERAAASAEAMASRTSKAAQQASAELNAFGNAATGSAGAASAAFSASSAIIIGAILAIVAAIAIAMAGMINFGVNAIQAGANYAQAMNTVQTLSETTNSKMSQLNDTILQIATTTTASMGQAANAAAELAKGGVSVEDAMNGALKSVVNLSQASAGELQLADAAQAVAKGMAAFNLHGTESVRVADAITGVAQSTTATYNDLAHSLQQVGTIAHSLNYTIEDTYTAIGLLALNGIKGSDAGTALRTMFQHLEKPSKAATEQLKAYNVSLYDAQGNSRPLRDVVINLEKAFGQQAIAAGKLTQAQRDYALATIFGTDGQRAALSLINQGVAGYDRLAQAQKSLTAEDVAGKMILPLNAQLAILANNIDAVAVQFGGAFEPALQKAVGIALQLANTVANSTAALTLMGNAVSALATGEGFDALYTQITNVFGDNTGSKVIEFVNLFRNIGNAIGEYILPAFARLGEAIGVLFSNTGDMDQFSAIMITMAQGARIFAAVIGFVIDRITDFVNILTQLGPGAVAGFAMIAAATNPVTAAIYAMVAGLLAVPKAVDAVLTALIALPPLGTYIGATFSNLGTAIAAGLSTVGSLFSDLGTAASAFADSLGQVAQAGLSALGGMFSAIGTQARAFADAVGTAIQNALQALAPLAPAVLLIAAPFITLVAIAVTVGQQLGGVVAAVAGAFSALGSTANAIVKGFGDSFSALGDLFKIVPKEADASVEATNKALSEGLKAGVDAAIGVINGLVTGVGGAFSALGALVATLGKSFGDSFSAMGAEIQPLWAALWTWVYNLFVKVAGGLIDAASLVGTSFGALFSAIGTTVNNIWNATWVQVVTVFSNFIKTIVQNVATFANSIAGSFASAGNAIGSVWTQVWNGIVNIATRALNALAEKLNGFFNALKASPVGEFVAGVVGGFQQFGDTAIENLAAVGAKVDEIQGNIQGQLATLQSGLFSVSGAFEGINYAAVPALNNTADAINRVGNAAQSTEPAVQDFGDGGKKAAKDFEDAMKRLRELFEDTMRKLQNLAEDTSQRIADAWKKHEDDMLKATSEFTRKEADLYTKVYDDLAKEEEAYQRNINRNVLREGLQESIDLNRIARQRVAQDADTARQRELEDTRRARDEKRELIEQGYQYEIEDQERAIKRGVESIDVGMRRQNQAVQDGLREQQQIQSRALSQMFDAANSQRQEQYAAEDAAISRQRDQAAASRQYAQDLQTANSPEDRLRIQQRYQQAQQDLAVRAGEQQADLQRQAARKAQDLAAKAAQQAAEDALKRTQQAQERALSQSQEDADTKRKQGQEDADLARQRNNATKLRDFRKGLDAEERKTQRQEDDEATKQQRIREDTERGLRKAEDQLVKDQSRAFDLEDHILRINQIIKEANTAIGENRRAYEEKKKDIDAALDKELDKIQETYDKSRRALVQSWEDAWNEILQKSPAVQGELVSLFGTFMAQAEATDAIVQGLINDLRTTIALQGQVAGNTTPDQGTANAEDNSTPQSGPEPALIGDDTPDFAHGGVVPGKWGSRQRIIAHGGEVYMGLQNQMAQYMPAAMQLASVSNQANVQNISNTSMITNVTYSVNANYQNQQSPANISMDLQALGAMTRR